MGGSPIAIGVAAGQMSITCRVKGLHLHKSEGVGTVKPLKDNIRDMGQAGTLGLHEGLHALILPPTRAAINEHLIPPQDGRANAA